LQVDDYVFSFKKSLPNPTKPPIAWLKAMLSCTKRHEEEFEHLTWDNYILSNLRGNENPDAIKFFQNTPKSTASVHSTEASVRALSYTLNRFFTNNGLDVLNAPTNEAFFDNWEKYLKSIGVKFEFNTTLLNLQTSNEVINKAIVTSQNVEKTVEADYFVCAIPHLDLEKVIKRSDVQGFDYLAQLKSGWQAGIVFYLDKDLDFPDGHFGLSKSPWNITGILQSNYWNPESKHKHLHSKSVKASLSLIIADWDLAGSIIKKPAKECLKTEIVEELLYQLKTYCPQQYQESFAAIASSLVDYTIDPALHLTGNNSASNETPLFMNVVNHWENRPNAQTNFNNLFIAGDFAKTSAYLATMESANEAGRRAANAVLTQNKNTNFCDIFTKKHTDTPQIFKPFIKIDEILYDYDKSHLIDYLDNQQVDDFIEALLPYIDFEGRNLKNLDKLFNSIVKSLQQLLDKLPMISEQIIKLLLPENTSKDTVLQEELTERAYFWANISLKLGKHQAKEFPESLKSYIDIDNPVFQPLLHVAKHKGSMNRAAFAMALNVWYQVPHENITHLMETGQVLHNCSLLIDDIMDNTTVRRNDKAAHELFGTSQTIGAAYATCFQVLLSTYINLGSQCLLYYMEETTRAHLGQADDIYHRETKICPTEEKYIEMVANKTGSFFRVFSLCLSALSPQSSLNKSVSLSQNQILKFADTVGKLYQIKDDYMDLMSEEYFIKKGTFASDFEEGKYSFPLVYCLQVHTKYKEKIENLLGKKDISLLEKNELLNYLQITGSLDYTLVKIKELYQQSIDLLTEIEQKTSVVNLKMRNWLKTFIQDTPNFDYQPQPDAVFYTPKETKRDVFEIQTVTNDTMIRALRNVFCTYHVYFQQHQWTQKQFWECFPLLLTVETMIIGVDNANENSKEKKSVLTKSTIKESKAWQFIAKSSFYSPEMDTILEQAISYFEMEKQWYADSNEVMNSKAFEEMNHYKSCNFRILHYLAINICKGNEATSTQIEQIEDYTSLLIEEFEQNQDRKENKYNVFLHSLKISDVSLFREYKKSIDKQLNKEEIATALRWFRFYQLVTEKFGNPPQKQTAKADLKKIYALAKEIAIACDADDELANFTLQGNFKWCINKFFAESDTSQDSILRRLQKDALLSLSN
jgi:geranylgeranyl pyrophosphate synthase/uncharacterized protein with NAD-binding domain and iron-sulfur cluster